MDKVKIKRIVDYVRANFVGDVSHQDVERGMRTKFTAEEFQAAIEELNQKSRLSPSDPPYGAKP